MILAEKPYNRYLCARYDWRWQHMRFRERQAMRRRDTAYHLGLPPFYDRLHDWRRKGRQPQTVDGDQ